ncbi:MAG: hypothetical protein U5Q03_01495 [Bacteroidota bacterium]|nr:hypothetical protein [Bacteroidota bacterium]
MKARIIFSILSLLAICNILNAQHFTSAGGARAAAMARAATAQSGFWSLQNNQAGLGFTERSALVCTYENRFLLKEIANKFVGLVFSTRSGTFGLSYQQYGYRLYSESIAGLSFGKKLAENFAAGIRIDYLSCRFAEDYGSKGWISFQIGMLYQLNEKLSLGTHLAHPLQQKTASVPDERLPSVLSFGLSYSFSKDLVFTIDTRKNSLHPLSFRSGMEYEIREKLFSRIGFSSNPARIAFGCGIGWGRMQLDIASTYQQLLGFSPAISLLYQFR